MRIKSIRLKNRYKHFFDLTIDLGPVPKKIIALVGPNGCGKSSVFDGMVYKNQVFSPIGLNGNSMGNEFHSMNGTNVLHTNIEIMFDNGENFDQVFSQRQRPQGINTLINLRNSYRYIGRLNINSLATIPDIKINNVGASSTADLDDKMTMNYQRLFIYLTKFRKDNDLTDRQAKTTVLGELNAILSNCLGLILSDEGDITAGKGMLYFTKPTQPGEFSFNVLSSGEKEVVDILLDIFLKREEFNDSIYIIDEPELHLNTAIQRKLLIEIEKLIPDSCQLWVATHSMGFLNALQNELRDKSDVIDFKGDYSTEVFTLQPMQKTRKNWLKIFETALDDLTGLIAPSVIIYCEGRLDPDENGEEQGLDADVYNTIFAETNPEILFVSSGGNTEPLKYSGIALKVLNKAFADVTILLLRDKDINHGVPTTDQERLDFLASNPELNRMLKRQEVENYVFDFEIISKAYQEVTEDEYNKIVPDIKADIKSKAGDLMRLCGIGNEMNKQQFKRRLAEFIKPDTAVFIELNEVLSLPV